MPGEKTSQIVRLQDGSIDYQYYSAKGLIAKNREMKIVTDKVLGTSPMTMRIIPAFLTVILLALIL
ncbi:MAG: hypothetical protein DRR15_12485 [Gammaproteobacteria bacterium]|nr:MAG: hypothetical protein DRR15_12485 [Gammaproteobacteria bacterium]